MKLRTRLMIAFLSIVLIPVILMGITFSGIGQYQMHIVEKNFGIDEEGYTLFLNSVKIFSKATEDIQKEISQVAVTDPARLQDEDYLNKMNKQLQLKSSYLVMREEKDIYFCGDEDKCQQLKDKFPEYDSSNIDMESEVYLREDQILIKQVDFEFGNGKPGSVFIITEISDMLPEIKATVSQMIISIVLIMIFTGIALVYWIYGGLVSPLKQLREAAQNITEGNLDFTIRSEHDDEIGSLCANFEEMRRRLKDSAEEKLEIDRENRALISNITHDLKTPVTAIKGYAEGIMDGVADTPEKMDKYIRTIYNKANEMDRLINELTFYSGIDANRIPYNFAKIDVGKYFIDCVEELEMDLESRNIKLNYLNYLEEGTMVIADPIQMKKVVNNIIGNSAKYIDKPRGVINIRIRDAEEFVIIEIEDNGKGIAAKDLPYIFDRFYRTDASRNSAQGGSGIGLSIVRKIVEDHGGRIWATSKQGTGTTILMELRKYKEVKVNE